MWLVFPALVLQNVAKIKAPIICKTAMHLRKVCPLFQTKMTLLQFSLAISQTGVMMKMKNMLLTALIGRYNINNIMNNTMAQMSLMSLIHPPIQQYHIHLKKI
uniref:Uncharacterized protein n=1 Tax=Arundo donax TaxID=35708 RepID=A0A0A8ZUP3_ARUDO